MNNMDRASQNTIILANAGLINNPNICIKNFGATIVCVCKECSEEFLKEIESMSECMDNQLLTK